MGWETYDPEIGDLKGASAHGRSRDHERNGTGGSEADGEEGGSDDGGELHFDVCGVALSKDWDGFDENALKEWKAQLDKERLLERVLK